MRRERNIWSVVLIVGLAVAAAACGKKAEGSVGPSGPTANSTPALPTSEMLRADACACTTTECGDQAAQAIEQERQRVEQNLAAGEACLASSGLGGPAVKVLRMMTTFKDQICACKDPACIENVEKEMMTWALAHMEELKKAAQQAPRATKEQANRIEDEMEACKDRVMPPSAPPSTSSPTP